MTSLLASSGMENTLRVTCGGSLQPLVLKAFKFTLQVLLSAVPLNNHFKVQSRDVLYLSNIPYMSFPFQSEQRYEHKLPKRRRNSFTCACLERKWLSCTKVSNKPQMTWLLTKTEGNPPIKVNGDASKEVKLLPLQSGFHWWWVSIRSP